MTGTPLVAAEGLTRTYARPGWIGRRSVTRAVEGVDLTIAPRETLGLVGESGSGKTTLGRMLLHLLPPTAGRVHFDGVALDALDGAALRTLRRRMQIVFQDPYGSLNPRMRVGAAVAEPLEVHRVARGADARRRADDLLAEVGLDPVMAARFPHELSGGQRQRVAIARALALRPEFVVLDEPVAALDVSVQAQVLRLLTELRDTHGLTYLFIAHDLAVVRHLAHRVAVMYAGRLVEVAETAALYGDARHPYTHALLAAVPVPDPARPRPRVALRGDMGTAQTATGGCPFRARCLHPARDERCTTEVPALRSVGDAHLAACHYGDVSSQPSQPSPPGDPGS